MDLHSVLILLTLCHTKVYSCPQQCKCVGDTMSCVNNVPHSPTRDVTKVYLHGIDASELNSSRFGRSDWENVTFLDIFVSTGRTIYSGSFTGLDNLEHIGIHGDDILKIETSVFYTLPKIKTLDLSYNYYLSLTYVLPALDASVNSVLSSLENLTLASLNFRQANPMKLDESAIAILANGRSIKYLDLSQTSIGSMDFKFLHLLCKSLEYVKFQKTVFGHMYNFFGVQPCSSLKTMDLTEAIFPITADVFDFDVLGFNCPAMVIYSPIQHLYMSGILQLSKPMHIVSYYLNMYDCNFHLNKLLLNKNNMQWLNLTVEFPMTMRRSFVELDMAENLIEYYSPKALNQLENLECFNLSHNSLYVMQNKYSSDFEILFQSLKKLRRLVLAFNKITNIPKGTFSENKLIEFIDLSNNKLTDVTFELHSLKALKYLALSRNHIKVLSHFAMNQLDNLKTLTIQTRQMNHSETLDKNGFNHPETKLQRNTQAYLVDLSWNTFQCTCDITSLDFLKWIGSSGTMITNNTEGYTCDLGGKTINLLQSASSETEAFCEHQQLLRTIAIAGPVVLVVCMAIIATSILLRKFYIKRKRIKDIIKQIQRNQFQKKFLVFLSFASEEDEFVRDKVLNQLEQSLSLTVDKPGTYVSYGDRDFRLGRYVHEEVNEAIEQSAVVIFVVSNAFCSKEWCKMEVSEASRQRKPTIMLMKEHVNTQDMPKSLRGIFKSYVHATWVNDEHGGHIEPNWHAVSRAILHLASVKMEFGPPDDTQMAATRI